VPVYVFRCNRCQHRFDELLGVEEVPSPCPICGAASLQRVATSAALLRPAGRSCGQWPAESMREVGSWAESRLDRLGMGSDPEVSEIIEQGRSGTLVERAREQMGV
jgi:putative FmdB family regulatory protein